MARGLHRRLGSSDFSKRADESVRSPTWVDVRRTAVASKVATSRSSESVSVATFRTLAAHDAGERDGCLARADQEVGGLQRAGLAVEGLDRLAVPRVPDDDPPTAAVRLEALPIQGGAVEDVVGLAEVHHYEVREIDEQVDRSLADGEQEPAEPVRRRPRLHSVDGQADVAAASGRLDRERIGRPSPVDGSEVSSGSSSRS